MKEKSKYRHRFIASKFKFKHNILINQHEMGVILKQYSDFQRPILKAKVQNYRDAIKLNQWNTESGIEIKFDRDGNLIDGQHRMYAFLAEDRPFLTDVKYGLPPEAILNQDIGKSRDPHVNPVLFDCRQEGKKPEKSDLRKKKYCFSIARLMLAYESGVKWISPSSNALENKWIADKEYIEFAGTPGCFTWMKRPGPRAAIAEYAKKDKVKAKEFLNKYLFGGSEDSECPISKLKIKIEKKSKGGDTTKEDMAYTIHAINCFHNGLRPKKLRQQRDLEF